MSRDRRSKAVSAGAENRAGPVRERRDRIILNLNLLLVEEVFTEAASLAREREMGKADSDEDRPGKFSDSWLQAFVPPSLPGRQRQRRLAPRF
jgi:hypothetical protein